MDDTKHVVCSGCGKINRVATARMGSHPRCGACKYMAPAFANAAADLAPGTLLAKVSTEEAPRTAGRFDIRSIPTVVAFRQGREVARQPGAMSRAQIVQWVRSHVG